MPHGNCSTAFVSQDIYQLLTIHGSMDTGQQLLHNFFFIQISFVTQSFDLKMTYFRRWLSRQKLLLFKCKLLNKTPKQVTFLVYSTDRYVSEDSES